MRYVINIILWLVFFVANLADAATEDMLLWSITYHFFHANIFHLLINSFSIWVVFKRFRLVDFVYAFIIASASIYFTSDIVVGFSNIIYATIGLRTPDTSSGWWRRLETIVFLSVTVLMLFFPHVSAITHIISFCSGVLLAIVRRRIKQIIHDSKRYY